MNPFYIITIIVLYFLVLIVISHLTKGNSDNNTFFLAERKSKWYVVAYGMIGASLSGVTFLSVPGWVGGGNPQEFFYMQMVLGYVPGYLFIAYVLIPVFYKMKVHSIYQFLKVRFGFYSHKFGAFYFFISRVIGASLRLFLVVEVLQLLVFDEIGISFYITTIVTIVLIWIYTNQGGIKTIIWTDTLQTTFMILTALICIISLFNELGYDSIQDSIEHSSLSLRFFMFDSFREKNHFIRYFLSGMFMAIAMTGLDQDMMQKNLTCKSIVGAQRNIIGLSISLIFINLLFLYLGALLYDYASMCNINAQGDKLFTSVIMSSHLGVFVFISFLLGLISAAYSSADSALTSLTTCFCIDFLNIEKESSNTKAIKTRKYVHLLVSILIFCFIVFIKFINQGSIISTLFTFAGYTYGPLLGLFFFGLFTKRKLIDYYVPLVVIMSPLLTFGISHYSYIINFEFGYELLLINGLITFLGLFIISYSHSHVSSNNKLV